MIAQETVDTRSTKHASTMTPSRVEKDTGNTGVRANRLYAKLKSKLKNVILVCSYQNSDPKIVLYCTQNMIYIML